MSSEPQGKIHERRIVDGLGASDAPPNAEAWHRKGAYDGAGGATDPNAPYFPPQHFTDLYSIPGERLRQARADGRLPARNVSKSRRPTWHYSEPGARRLWPNDFPRP